MLQAPVGGMLTEAAATSNFLLLSAVYKFPYLLKFASPDIKAENGSRNGRMQVAMQR